MILNQAETNIEGWLGKFEFIGFKTDIKSESSVQGETNEHLIETNIFGVNCTGYTLEKYVNITPFCGGNDNNMTIIISCFITRQGQPVKYVIFQMLIFIHVNVKTDVPTSVYYSK